MTQTPELEIAWQVQGAMPHYRYDHVQPLLQGRVHIEGVKLLLDDPMVNASFYEDPRFKDGDFGLLDVNWGDTVPAIAEGWDLVLLPVFIKRKPAYNYLWVRADRAIDAPRDLEGKTIATGGYNSAITIYTRGFLHDFYGVDLSRLNWLSTGPRRFDIHDGSVKIEYATGPRKSQVQRLLDGEVDACTGDITDAKSWAALESSSAVKLMFPDYQELNRRLFLDHGIFTPVHVLALGGRLNRDNPGLARRIYEGFERSLETAAEDALGDGTAFSLNVNNREVFKDQLRTWGDPWKNGLQANRNAVERFLDYCFAHGVTKARLQPSQVFAASTLDT